MSKSIDRYISIRSIKHMQLQCSLLKLFGIIGFTHDISFPMGELSMLTTNENVFRLWFNKRLPAIQTDESGRTLNSGIYLDSYLAENYEDFRELAPIYYAQLSADRTVHIVERHDDCQSLYSFSFQQIREKDFLHWIVNNVYQLENFIEEYKYTSKELIAEAKKPANRILLPIIKKNDFKENELPQLVTDKIMQKIIHKESKIPIFLSKQQSICLALLMQGKTAKEIAIKMKLSHRTVQHYFDRIRNILDCASNKELIIAYGNQVVSEQWDPIRQLFD